MSRLLLLKATMNRYPLWKYIIVAVALVLGFVYTLPNFFGESSGCRLSFQVSMRGAISSGP